MNVVEKGDKVTIALDNGVSQVVDLVIGADGVGSHIRAGLYSSHARFERLPYINIQMKLSTPASHLPTLLDKNGINALLGTRNYSLLLVPLYGQPGPDHPEKRSNVCEDQDKPIIEVLNQKRPSPYLFAILTIRCFDGWDRLRPDDWKTMTIELLTADKADPALIEAFQNDVIPGTIGTPWQVVSCDPARPVPYNGGRVVLIGDAVHAMPPQAGAGASTALMDAYKLAEVVISLGSSGK